MITYIFESFLYVSEALLRVSNKSWNNYHIHHIHCITNQIIYTCLKLKNIKNSYF